MHSYNCKEPPLFIICRFTVLRNNHWVGWEVARRHLDLNRGVQAHTRLVYLCSIAQWPWIIYQLSSCAEMYIDTIGSGGNEVAHASAAKHLHYGSSWAKECSPRFISLRTWLSSIPICNGLDATRVQYFTAVTYHHVVSKPFYVARVSCLVS